MKKQVNEKRMNERLIWVALDAAEGRRAYGPLPSDGTHSCGPCRSIKWGCSPVLYEMWAIHPVSTPGLCCCSEPTLTPSHLSSSTTGCLRLLVSPVPRQEPGVSALGGGASHLDPCDRGWPPSAAPHRALPMRCSVEGEVSGGVDTPLTLGTEASCLWQAGRANCRESSAGVQYGVMEPTRQ